MESCTTGSRPVREGAARSLLRGFAAAICGLLLLAGPVGAQRTQGPPRRSFAERVEVRVINLEAVVVDRRGQRVRGLLPADFALKVDGEPVTIEYFSEIADGLAVAPPQDSGATLPAAVADVAGTAARVSTSYLVFIDSYFTRRAGRRNRILREIEANLARLGPDDRMAIVAFDGRRLEVLSSWSGSPQELAGALETARGMPARGFITRQLADDVDRAIEIEEELASVTAGQTGPGGETEDAIAIREDGLPSDICTTIERLERQIGRAVTGVTAALRSFARPPGRKVMLLLSGGWPQSAKDFLVGSQPFGAIDCPAEGAAIYRPIFETANRLGYTLYPIDVPSPDGAPVDAEDSGDLFAPGAASSDPVGGLAQIGRTFEVHSTLRTLAGETGGTALIDGAAERAFDSVVDDTRTYYWLGFTPEWQGDDASHEVELEVLRPGLEVRSRSGYLDLSLQTEISNVTESALLFGDLPGAQAVGLELGEMPRKGRGKLTVPMRLEIPMDAITMVPRKRGFAAELELRIAVVDDGGNRNDMPIIPVLLEGAEPPPPGAHAVYETAIKIRRRPHDVVVSLYDPLSDTILAATAKIQPEKP